MHPPSRPPRPFFGRVESLRGLGALTVAGYHFGGLSLHGVPLLPDVSWDGASPVQNGLRQLGVAALAGHAFLMAFFVISGFVLRVSLDYGPRAPARASAKFVLARLFRLYPIVLFGVAVAALVAPHPVTTREILANAFLIDVSLNGTWWALQLELLMVPAILALYFLERATGPRTLLLIALPASALLFTSRWAWWTPLSTNFFAFVLGMIVPTIGREFATGLMRRGAGVWLAVAVAAFLLPNVCFGRYTKSSTFVEGYAAFALVSLVAYRQDLFALRWLDWRPLRMLGTASGSYYVLHMMTVPVAMAVASALVPPAWSAAAPALVGVLVLSVWLAAFAPVSLASYYLIEAPGIALGRRAARWLGLDVKPAAMPVPAEREPAPAARIAA